METIRLFDSTISFEIDRIKKYSVARSGVTVTFIDDTQIRVWEDSLTYSFTILYQSGVGYLAIKAGD